MKRTTAIIVGTLIVGAGLITPTGYARADMDHKQMQGMGNEYCTKHCRAMDIRKQLDALKAEVEADKKAGTFTGGKAVEIQNKAKTLREHLAKHEKEFTDLETELGRVEADLK